MKAVFFVLLGVAALSVYARDYTLGIDVAYDYPQESFDCLHNEHAADFAIVRCYRSIGSVDTACPNSVKRAWNAGFKHVDIYLFPCVKCGNATNQIATLKAYVEQQNIKFGLLWLDVEMRKQYWLDDDDANKAFFTELASAGKRYFGSQMGGVYTNKNGWTEIFGGEWTGGADMPLWWAYWDSLGPAWDNFKPFAGWNTPSIKQYKGDTKYCNMDIDLDSY